MLLIVQMQIKGKANHSYAQHVTQYMLLSLVFSGIISTECVIQSSRLTPSVYINSIMSTYMTIHD